MQKETKQLLPYHCKDFTCIFTGLKGVPASTRLLYPPLHRLLPHEAKFNDELAKTLRVVAEVGTMIEVPRGALTADEIAVNAEFFSFGTNDLTQTALGICGSLEMRSVPPSPLRSGCRDDMGNFLMPYTEAEVFKKNPFATLDTTGVGQLMEIAVKKGRATRPDIKLGICGEHGGDPDSVKFCHKLGLAYVSCSPYRVPVARLAAAQAAIEEKRAAAKTAPAKKK